MKYDTTLKLPVNHNFNAIAVNFVQAATIRYVRADGYYFRMEGKNYSYNEETGMVVIDGWKKGSKWKTPETPNNTTSCYDDMIKINAYVGDLGETIETSTVYVNNIDASSVVITTEDEFYTIEFSVNAAAANADSRTTNSLNQSNGSSNTKYEYCNVKVEVWKCGLVKYMEIDEKWHGKIKMFSGAADSKAKIYYSYDIASVSDTSLPDSIIREIGE